MKWLFVLLIGTACSGAEAPNMRQWDDYQVIMWVSGKTTADPAKTPLVVQRLREMGVSAGMVTGEGDPTMWTQGRMPYYVENIVRTGLCLKFRSPVTDWGKFINDWMQTRDEAAFVRPYCLEDPAWLTESKKWMQRAARMHQANAPLLYDIRDELSTTISANPFDYDFSPQSLAGFRKWLQEQYDTLEALNKQWDTDFPSWEVVKPFSTDQIKRRMITGERMPKGPPDDWSALKHVKFDPMQAAKEPVKWNFSPWCDFRSYMDTVLARTLDTLRQSTRDVDSATPVGIEGTQMPHAFGGYDLWKLSQSLDWVEPYDVANSREILGAFMPGKPMLCTLFEKDAEHAMRRLWHLLLLGDKGCIVWWSEDCIDATKPDCPLTEKGKALAPVFREMQSPLAQLFMRAERETDPIAIHYSHASIQIAWLLESVADGKTWPRRFSSFESGHSRHAKVRNGWLKMLQDAGYTPRFVSTEQMENGELHTADYRALILPDSIALTKREAEAVHSWTAARPSRLEVVDNGNAHTTRARFAIAHSGMTSQFDGHGRFVSGEHSPVVSLGGDTLRPASCLSFLQWDHSFTTEYTDIAGYPALRLEWNRKMPSEHPADFKWRWDRARRDLDDSVSQIEYNLARSLKESGEVRVCSIPDNNDCIRTHRYRMGNARLLAFERGVDYHMSEDLKQAGGNEPLEKPITFIAKLSGKAHIYDLRSGTYLGELTDLVVDLDPWKPSLFALLAEKLPDSVGAVEHLLREAGRAVR
jgi:hypothetical protein